MSSGSVDQVGRAWAALASGSKSLLFQIEATAEPQPEQVSVGAMVTTSDHRPLPWGDVDREVLLNFWQDAARLYVHEDVEFTVWYSRTIGTGVISSVLDDLFDAPVPSLIGRRKAFEQVVVYQDPVRRERSGPLINAELPRSGGRVPRIMISVVASHSCGQIGL